ncbi:hypothetical protein ACFWFI_16660 [Streptomyces sp. NPDC060209]|uniref:hypothetical protein n=1 Tax=Streptomyces sp. NPDC060209 TaxID=3347073 RepID=UPI0036692618
MYEFTADAMYTLAEGYREVKPDFIVVTNPNCRGFSTDSLRAASQVGMPLIRFSDFLDKLGTEWNSSNGLI